MATIDVAALIALCEKRDVIGGAFYDAYEQITGKSYQEFERRGREIELSSSLEGMANKLSVKRILLNSTDKGVPTDSAGNITSLEYGECANVLNTQNKQYYVKAIISDSFGNSRTENIFSNQQVYVDLLNADPRTRDANGFTNEEFVEYSITTIGSFCHEIPFRMPNNLAKGDEPKTVLRTKKPIRFGCDDVYANGKLILKASGETVESAVNRLKRTEAREDVVVINNYKQSKKENLSDDNTDNNSEKFPF